MKKKTPTKQTDDTIEKAYRVQLQQKRETNQLDGNVKKDWTTDERDGWAKTNGENECQIDQIPLKWRERELWFCTPVEYRLYATLANTILGLKKWTWDA